MTTRSLARASFLLALALAPGCLSTNALDVQRPFVTEGQAVKVHYDPEIGPEAASAAARAFALVRATVAEELALAPNDPPPFAEIVLYRDSSWGQDRFLVTHAVVEENPLRVFVPCPLPPDLSGGDRIAAIFRGTIAHEIAEATVLTRVRILDPYLRWMHDGIAESVEYRVLRRLDPEAAEKTIKKYRDYAVEADSKHERWVDLTRWRQLSEFLLHSEAFFEGRSGKPSPLRLDDFKGSLDRLANERVALELSPDQPEKPERLQLFLDIESLLGENEVKKNLPLAPPLDSSTSPEVDPKQGGAAQYLFYDASFCFWLELERAHPGMTARVLAAMSARRDPVLRSRDVLGMIEETTGEKLSVRLQRFTLTRLLRVLDAEKAAK